MARATKPNPSTLKDLLLNSGRAEQRRIDRVWRIIEPMLVLHYPPYYAETPEELLRQSAIGLEVYIDMLAEFDHDVLWSAWLDVLERHRDQKWPAPGVIVEAARNRKPGPKTQQAAGVQSREREKQLIADLLHGVLFNGDLGQQAAQEGWAYELKLFLTKNARRPTPAEVSYMRTAYDRVKQTMAEMEQRAAAGEELLGMESLRAIHKHWPIREANLAEQILKRAAA